MIVGDVIVRCVEKMKMISALGELGGTQDAFTQAITAHMKWLGVEYNVELSYRHGTYIYYQLLLL